MIERHWDGIAAFCKSENKVSSALCGRLLEVIIVFGVSPSAAPMASETKNISAKGLNVYVPDF